MKKLSLVAILCAMVFAFACTPKATPDECNASCKKLASFEKKPPIPDTTQEVMKSFQPKIDKINNDRKAAEGVVDEKYKKDSEKVAKMKDKDKNKPKKEKELADKIAKEKAEIAAKPEFSTTALNQEMAKAVADARDKKAKAEKAAKEADEKKVTECSEKCVTEGTSQPKAQCQAGAPSKDEFEKCQ